VRHRIEDALTVLVDGVAVEQRPPDAGVLRLELIREADDALVEGARADGALHAVAFEVVDVQGGHHPVLLRRNAQAVRTEEG
jgi:hypothetical protein